MNKNDKNRESVEQEIAEINDEAQRLSDEKKAKNVERREALKAAKELLRKHAENVQDDELKNAILLVAGKRANVSSASASVNAKLRSEFIEKGKISELDIFTTYRIGRPEMNIKARIFVKCANPDDRIWISFNPETEVYELLGVGANPPEGFSGYIPADAQDLG